MELGFSLLIMAAAFGFFMAWGVGANDVANAMGTSVGSKAITIRQAIVIAAIFECAGALLAGGEVTDTIRGEIIDTSALSASPELLVYGMLAALLAAGTWLFIASYRGWPVSTTHSILGAIIGFAVIELGPDAIYWNKVTTIGLSWIVTPLISGVLAFGLFRSIQILVLNTENPFQCAKRYGPFYIFLVAMVITLVTLLKGLKHLGLHLSLMHTIVFSLLISTFMMLVGVFILRRIQATPDVDPRFDFKSVEKIFGTLMIFTASCMAFAHGSNDVANAIGPLAAIVSIVQSNGNIAAQADLPLWVLILGALGIVTGLATYGHKVIATIGKHITELTPSHGFAAELATASTVLIATGIGLPISTTQTLVGGVLGVGLARGIGALNLKVIRNIFMSWIITLPAGAALAVLFFIIIKALF